MNNWKQKSIITATAFGLLVGGLNISSVSAKNLSELPVTEEFVFRNYKVLDNTFSADIEVLTINGLKDKKFETDLNNKFMAQSQAIYDSFNEQTEDMKKEGIEGHIFVGSNFEIKTDNDNVLSIILTEFTGMGSSNTIFKTYVVDKENSALVNLKDLFKDDKYIQVITDNIKEQMRAIMKADSSKIYDIDSKDGVAGFEKIKADQNFYINAYGQLCILFDKYEVAAGYMGTQEFIIPTDAIQALLSTQNMLK